MKDIFSAFGSEVYRPLIVQVLPGFVASSTWIIALFDRSSGFQRFLIEHTTEAALSITFASVFVGHICEDVGSRLEQFWFKQPKSQKADERWPEWYAYLRLAFKVEPVGHRYLRTLVLRLNFELNASVALIVASFGVLFTHIAFVNPYVLSAIMLAIACYLAVIEARASVSYLRELRSEMLKDIRIIG
jgi:hypothetical protein